MKKEQFAWTGNPFVDTGLCVIIARSKELGNNIQTISDLTIDAIKEVVKDGSWLAKINARLNSYTMVFGNNGPLKQTSTNPISQLNSHKNKIQEKKQEIQQIEQDIKNKIQQLPEETKKKEALQKTIENYRKKKHKLQTELKDLESKIKEKEDKADGSFDRGIEEYKIVINTLIEAIESGRHSLNVVCECCGLYKATTALQVASKEIRKVGNSRHDENMAKRPDFEIGRDWFPLIGSFNDAQALPSASRSASISALCLLAVQFLPLGVLLLNGKLACFQTNDIMPGKPSIFQFLIEEIYDELSSRIGLIKEKLPTLGTKAGTTSTTLILVKKFKDLQDYKQELVLPNYISLNIWLFTNSGTSPDCEIIEIPNKALRFLWEASRLYSDELKKFGGKKTKQSDDELLTAIQYEREYFDFFPKWTKSKPSFKLTEQSFKQLKRAGMCDEIINKLDVLRNQEYTEEQSLFIALKPIIGSEETAKFKSLIVKHAKHNKEDICEIASRKLFELYNKKVLKISNATLQTAEWVAEQIKGKLIGKQEQKTLIETKRSLGDSKKIVDYYSIVKGYLTEFAENGFFTLDEYTLLFPSQMHPLKAPLNSGLRLIWFYLNQDTTYAQRALMDGDLLMFTHPKIKLFANDIFEYFTIINKWEIDKFKKRILDRFRRSEISTWDIQRWFLNLAELKTGYTNEDWDDLCRDNNGNNTTNEVIFQLRLELANLYRLAIQQKMEGVNNNFKEIQ